MPISYHYRLAHAPFVNLTWTPCDDTAIIAEMITELAAEYEVHDDMVLITAHDYVPDLSEPMVRFQNVPLMLYMVCYAYYPDTHWPIPRDRMVRMLLLQHSDPHHELTFYTPRGDHLQRLSGVIPRGGMPRRRDWNAGNPTEQRAQMLGVGFG